MHQIEAKFNAYRNPEIAGQMEAYIRNIIRFINRKLPQPCT